MLIYFSTLLHNFKLLELNSSHQDIIEKIVTFLQSIDIMVVEQELSNDTFLPGLSIYGNSILMDLEKLKYPGDLLHEAGHIAITEEKIRPLIGTPKIHDLSLIHI